MKKIAKIFITASALLILSQTASSIAFTDCNTLGPKDVFTTAYTPVQEVAEKIVLTTVKELLNFK